MEFKLTILIPVLNETEILPRLFKDLKTLTFSEVVFCDGGSSDGSIEKLENFCEETSNSKLIKTVISRPSVGRTLAPGIAYLKQHLGVDGVCILPADCRLNAESFNSIGKTLKLSDVDYGGFLKRYVPTTATLGIYAFLQNLIRTNILGHLVWTNGIFFNHKVLKEVSLPEDGFLEDVIFSDWLKKHFRRRISTHEIQVDARRYYPRNTFRRIWINGKIMTLYRLGIKTPNDLKKLYTSQK